MSDAFRTKFFRIGSALMVVNVINISKIVIKFLLGSAVTQTVLDGLAVFLSHVTGYYVWSHIMVQKL